MWRGSRPVPTPPAGAGRRRRALLTETPGSAAEAADLLRSCAGRGWRVRPRGGGTKLGWGTLAADPEIELSTAGLGEVLEHNQGDLTAVVQAGVPLARAQEAFAWAGQRLALDPPSGPPADAQPASTLRTSGRSARDRPSFEPGTGASGPVGAATVGGVIAAADSGPLRHRYGGVRDLLLGVTVALPDGSVARAGGKVIKNVAGYDLSKLFAGSFGTLGVLVEACVRLHPLPERHVTAVGEGEDAVRVQAAAMALSHAPLEIEALDVTWRGGRGGLLARFAGAGPVVQAHRAERLMADAGLEARVTKDDAQLWDVQRRGQRSTAGAVVRVSGVQTRLADVLRAAAAARASVVGRAAVGLSWLTLEPREDAEMAAAVAELRRALHPLPCVVQDAAPGVRARVEVWGEIDPAAAALMRRVKVRFDPDNVCNPGVFVGGV